MLIPFLLCACVEQKSVTKITIDSALARASYKDVPFTVEPMDYVTITKHTVTIAPHDENTTYTLRGYFNGQVVSKTKNTVLKLENAYLENTSGKAALKCTAKTELSAGRESTNYIVSRGRGFAKNAALQGKRGIILGGSGTLYVDGNICHGIEAEEVKIKGSGTFYIAGTKRGSALTCEIFEVEPQKTFSAYILNAKNGIKADQKIAVSSGTFYLYNNGIALKTDAPTADGKKPRTITLAGGTFHLFGNGALYVTAEGAYNAAGATFIDDD